MTNAEKFFDFSKLVKLYCEHYEVVDTLEKRWKTETAELIERIKRQLAIYEKEWDLNLSNKWGSLKKRDWSDKTATHYEFWYDPYRIGKGIFMLSINVNDRDLREKIVKDIGDKIAKAFNPTIDLSNKNFVYSEIEVGKRNYGEIMLDSIQRCIDFSSNLDPYAIDK